MTRGLMHRETVEYTVSPGKNSSEGGDPDLHHLEIEGRLVETPTHARAFCSLARL